MRRTRILATIGPATDDPASIGALLAAGVDAFRLNFSHGSAATHAETVARIRDVSRAVGRIVPILQDLGGPKIRIGALDAPVPLIEGAVLTIERGDGIGRGLRVYCSFDALFSSVEAGHRLLVDDGRIELEVTAVLADRLEARVVSGGLLTARKGINVPGVILRTSAVTPKDIADLRAGIEMGVDLVAISFVQSAEDVLAARRVAVSAGAPDLPIIAKIERPQAVDGIEAILDVADGVMVARGDLGLELPLETLPAVQKRVVMAARRRGVPVILATQVLESMCGEPRPTRAEVTDAAHAVDERVDAIMLAAETAMGRYPVRAVSTLDAIIRQAERVIDPLNPIDRRRLDGREESTHGRALCEAAVMLAEHSGASAIVAVTQGGQTARMLATLRPDARILAATASAEIAARLGIVWGVTPFVTDAGDLAGIRQMLLASGLVSPGGIVVFVSMRAALGRDGTNFIHVEQI